jgi:hypothetical protein
VSVKLKLEIAFCFLDTLFTEVPLLYAKNYSRIIPEVTEVKYNVLKEYIQVRMK